MALLGLGADSEHKVLRSLSDTKHNSAISRANHNTQRSETLWA